MFLINIRVNNFGNVTFFAKEVGIICVGLDKIDLADVDFYEDDPKNIIHIKSLAWHNEIEKRKGYKKDLSKELMHVAWHPTRWWD